MKLVSLRLQNIRSFYSGEISSLSDKINIFIGKNNSGKSTILDCILFMQYQNRLSQKDITIDQQYADLQINYKNDSRSRYFTNDRDSFFSNLTKETLLRNSETGDATIYKYPAQSEPENLIYPYLSRRKVSNYSEAVSLNNSNSVTGNLQYLNSKIDRLINPSHPNHAEYKEICLSFFDFFITTSMTADGKEAALLVDANTTIPINAMGEGVASILGLIVDLCVAENKIFVIEEIENDIHPGALKKLLELIVKKSITNQFFISTHSNIVLKYLGAEGEAKIFHVTSSYNNSYFPVSNLAPVDDRPESRKNILEDLGYELYDFERWNGWLFLEESSAESIVNKYLIPWFAPNLQNKLRTFAAGGKDKIKPRFEDFNRLFVFLHLEQIYKNKAWVLIDDGEEEKKILDDLKKSYVENNNWSDAHFKQLSKHDFEEYYPKEFKEKFDNFKSELDKNILRNKKQNLLSELVNWVSENQEDAKTKFKNCFGELITILKEIEGGL